MKHLSLLVLMIPFSDAIMDNSDSQLLLEELCVAMKLIDIG